MDVGLELRQARERRGVTLQQISHSTKISLRVLQAIEAMDGTRLPVPVFTRSFVKTYAKEVGLDPDDTARRYLEDIAPPVPPEPSVPDAGPTPAPPERLEWLTAVAEVIVRGRFTTPAAIAAVVIGIIALSIRNYSPAHADTRPPTPAVGMAGSARADVQLPAPTGTAGTTPATLDHLHLTIAPTGPCWVRATVNGQAALAQLLQKGDRAELDAPSAVTLRVGAPGTFAFTINGAPARLPGPAGQPATIHVTKENYRTFLADGR